MNKEKTTRLVIDKIVDTCFVAALFLSLASLNLENIDIYFYYIFVSFLIPVLVYRYQTIDAWLVIIMSFLAVHSLINVLFGNNDLLSVLKNICGISFAYWFYYLVLKHYNYNISFLFQLYYKFSFWTATIGFIQFFSYLLHFKPGYNFSWLGLRVLAGSEFAGVQFYPIHSITGEPAAFAVLLAPAVYKALADLKSKTLNSNKFIPITIISSYLLTQSSTAYFGLISCAAVLTIHNFSIKRILIGLVAVPMVIFLLFSISPKFSERLESSVKLATGNIILDAATSDNVNGSSVILFNHFVIAAENAKNHPLGTGLGSHHIAFKRYNTLKVWFTGYGGPGSMILNLHDANSLFSRILSEFGYFGVILMFAFIFRNFIPSQTQDNSHLVLINHASLIALLTNILRGGHYFNLGLPFFVFCYYYSRKLNKSEDV